MDEVSMVRAMARHMDVPAIAQALGRSFRSVDSMIYRMGFSVLAMRSWTDEEDQALRLLGGELSIAELSERLGRSRHVVVARARALGVSLKKRGAYHHHAKHRPEKRQEFHALVSSGIAKTVAAKMIGVPVGTVQKWCSHDAA
jgi:hypothetical protein